MQEEFSIFNKHFKILSFSLCIVWGPNITKLLFSTADVLRKSLYGNLCLERQSFRNAQEEPANERILATFWKLWGITPFFNNPQTFKNWICLKQALPLFWLFFFFLIYLHQLFISTWCHWCSLNEVICVTIKAVGVMNKSHDYSNLNNLFGLYSYRNIRHPVVTGQFSF